MLGASDHRSEILGGWPVVSVRFTRGDEGETVVFVPLTVDGSMVESLHTSFCFFGFDERIDIFGRDFEHTSPHGVASFFDECW